ncbi:zinc ribbon domain-containing protein [Kitasatospora cathayae]|uniref:zinc ribbon domain-containing protein n=1 Tax=Kitasatospora cathayae TaxID=3004092 RepID=UPI0038601E34
MSRSGRVRSAVTACSRWCIGSERTSRGIALEDLTGIRERVKAKHDQRYRLHSWAFAQLGAFVEYKAQRAGVPVVHVSPAYTSRQCSSCRHTHRTNRVDQATFACRACGTTMHADDGAPPGRRLGEAPATSATARLMRGSGAKSTAPPALRGSLVRRGDR